MIRKFDASLEQAVRKGRSVASSVETTNGLAVVIDAILTEAKQLLDLVFAIRDTLNFGNLSDPSNTAFEPSQMNNDGNGIYIDLCVRFYFFTTC